MLRSRQNQAHDRRGVVSVEMALTVPLLFLVLIGCIEFARLNMLRNSLENACYKGARAGSIPGRTAQDAIDRAASELQLVGVRNSQVEVYPTTITDATPEITVTISLPLNDNAWVSPHFLKNRNLTRSCTLTREKITP